LEGVSRRGRNPGMKRRGREDRVARTWSTRRGVDGRETSHDKGIQGTKRHRRPFVEDNEGVCRKRVTKVTQPLITEHDARRRTTRDRPRRRLSHITCHRPPSPDGDGRGANISTLAIFFAPTHRSVRVRENWLPVGTIFGDTELIAVNVIRRAWCFKFQSCNSHYQISIKTTDRGKACANSTYKAGTYENKSVVRDKIGTGGDPSY